MNFTHDPVIPAQGRIQNLLRKHNFKGMVSPQHRIPAPRLREGRLRGDDGSEKLTTSPRDEALQVELEEILRQSSAREMVLITQNVIATLVAALPR